jgi:hypothetical protein
MGVVVLTVDIINILIRGLFHSGGHLCPAAFAATPIADDVCRPHNTNKTPARIFILKYNLLTSAHASFDIE